MGGAVHARGVAPVRHRRWVPEGVRQRSPSGRRC